MPVQPPGRQTRISSAAARSASVSASTENPLPPDSTTSKEPSGAGRSAASPSRKLTSSRSASPRSRGAVEEVRAVVDGDDRAEAAGRGQRGVAAPAGDVEDALAGAQVDRLAQQLACHQDPRLDRGDVRAHGRQRWLLDSHLVHGNSPPSIGASAVRGGVATSPGHRADLHRFASSGARRSRPHGPAGRRVISGTAASLHQAS
jgi:hypothetical protein